MREPGNASPIASIEHLGEGGRLDETKSTWPTGGLALPSVVVVSTLRGGPVGA